MDDDDDIDVMMGMEHLVLEQGHRGLEIDGLEIDDAKGFGLDDEEEEEEEEEDEEDHQHKRIRTTNSHHNHIPEDGGDDNNNGSTIASYVGSPSSTHDSQSQSQVKPEAEEMVIETMKPFHDPRKKVKNTPHPYHNTLKLH